MLCEETGAKIKVDCWLEVGDTLAKADPEPVLFVL